MGRAGIFGIVHKSHDPFSRFTTRQMDLAFVLLILLCGVPLFLYTAVRPTH